MQEEVPDNRQLSVQEGDDGYSNDNSALVDGDEAALHSGQKVDLFEDALSQLPRTLLNYEDPVVLPGSTEEEWEAALESYIPSVIRHQKSQLSERPVVTTTEKVLTSIFPPRLATVVDSEGKPVRLVQPVAHKQCSRGELSALKDVFDYKLQDSKARAVGICPVRRTIHGMLFDELLRQVTIDNPERGLLLLRIRDELQMSLDAYSSLYNASQDYGANKLQEGTIGKPDMLRRIKELTSENEGLRKEVKRLQTKHLSILRCVDEQQQTDQKKFAEEKAFWERTKQRLESHMEAVREAQEAEKRALRDGTA